MIARLIAWSARNVMLVLIATAFAVVGGIWALRTLPLDAIPDLSDTQVIVYTEFPGQAPQVVEDQVTYPLTTAMLTVPKSKVVRGFSFFGVSFVYVIFEDGTDIYWARSRVLEYLNAAGKTLPAGVTPALAPDATGVGWVYQYAVRRQEQILAELRSLQDWEVRFGLAKAEGVAEVASVGGFVKQYNVVIDPGRMRRSASRWPRCARSSARATWTWAAAPSSWPNTSSWCAGAATSRASRISRRSSSKRRRHAGAAQGHRARRTGARRAARHCRAQRRRRGRERHRPAALRRQRARCHRQRQGAAGGDRAVAAEGRGVVPVYDRSELIHRAIETLKPTLLEESLVVALVCVVFLLHVRSALVAIIMLPVGILMSFVAMQLLGLGSNIMSLGGIAIAIGAMVDAAIVMIENAHKHLERAPPDKPRLEILIEAACEVGPALFFSLLIITVSFLPIFTLEAQEGRLFGPLAYTKTFAMAAAALLSVTLVPALMVMFVRGRIIPEHRTRSTAC